MTAASVVGAVVGAPASIVGAYAAASPTPLPELDVTQVSPGLEGFLAIFAVAAACVALFFGLSRQLRRMRRGAEIRGIGPHGPIGDAGSQDAKSVGDDGPARAEMSGGAVPGATARSGEAQSAGGDQPAGDAARPGPGAGDRS